MVKDEELREQPRQPQPRDMLVFRIISRIEMILAVIFLSTMLFGALWQALGRYWHTVNWPGAGEIARYSLVSLTFIMVGFLVAHYGHVTVALIDTYVSGTVEKAVRVFAAVLITVTCVLLAWGAIHLVIAGVHRSSEVLQIPLSVYYSVPLTGFLLGAVRAIILILRVGLPEPDAMTFEDVEE